MGMLIKLVNKCLRLNKDSSLKTKLKFFQRKFLVLEFHSALILQQCWGKKFKSLEWSYKSNNTLQ